MSLTIGVSNNSQIYDGGVTWKDDPNKKTHIDANAVMKMPDEVQNFDQLMLRLPKTETIYKKKELVANDYYGEGTALCYMYLERTLTFDDGKGGTFDWKLSSNECVGIIGADKTTAIFGKSTVGINEIQHAVEETWEVRERTIEQSTYTVAELREWSKNGISIDSFYTYSEKSNSYKFASAATTEGSVKYKNGAEAAYRENAVSSRELYNKCVSVISAAFGEDTSDMELTQAQYEELFGKSSGSEKSFSDILENKRTKAEKHLDRIHRYMKEKLGKLEKDEPNSKFLLAFKSTYNNANAIKAADVAAWVKMLNKNLLK